MHRTENQNNKRQQDCKLLKEKQAIKDQMKKAEAGHHEVDASQQMNTLHGQGYDDRRNSEQQNSNMNEAATKNSVDIPGQGFEDIENQKLGNRDEGDRLTSINIPLRSIDQTSLDAGSRGTYIQNKQRQNSIDSYVHQKENKCSKKNSEQNSFTNQSSGSQNLRSANGEPAANAYGAGQVQDFSGDKEQLNADYRVSNHYLKEFRDHGTWSNAQAYYNDNCPKAHTAPEMDKQVYLKNSQGIVQTPYDDGFGAVKSFNYQDTVDDVAQQGSTNKAQQQSNAAPGAKLNADNKTALKNAQASRQVVRNFQPDDIARAVNSNYYSNMTKSESPFCEHDSLHYCCKDAGINEENVTACIQKNLSDQEMAKELDVDAATAASLRRAFEINGLSDKPERKNKQ